MDIYTSCIYESADFHHTGFQTQGGGPKTKSPPPGQKGSFRCATLGLGVLYFLMLAGIIILSIRFTLGKNQLSNCSLQSNHSEKCPDRWTRFGNSFYFKFIENKTWYESRKLCQDKGADLVIINSKEEQEFINELNMRGESWIGLERYSQKHEWKWVDGSLLTEIFWAPGQKSEGYHIFGVCCDSDGRWRKSSYDEKTFICEK
ncbi:unnamed protein product [Oreochromis niloticus]|nr:unnamed protein product [Mustela putorius furo]